MDSTLLVFLLGLPILLVGISYKAPDAYDSFIDPGLDWLMAACFVGGLAAMAGEQYLFHAIESYIVPAMKADAKSKYEAIFTFTGSLSVAGLLVLAFNMFLDRIAKAGKKAKTVTAN